MINQFTPLPKYSSAPSFNSWLDELNDEHRAIIEQAAPVLETLFTAAPYLFSLAQKHPEFLCNSLQISPQISMEIILETVSTAGISFMDDEEFSNAIRLAKDQVALLVSIAETGKVWTAKQAAIALSDFADISLEASLNFLVRQASVDGKFIVSDTPVLASNCGLFIFALGKHGGRELNYSSDIDIVAFFDPHIGILQNPDEASKTYARIVRKLAALMQDRTAFGYVFRTDLRLRPDPGSTPVALSVDAALSYYESRGQNWERAAWIKARAVAGHRALADDFLKNLAPFIWRKHLDFATIADIQAMKRQINIAQNVGEERLIGHNVKLGRGGIREIEFFAQTQQLIAGGREQGLRVIPTVEALQALAQFNWIKRQTAQELGEAYWFLRAVENRVQMLNDEQTHILPENENTLGAISLLLGFVQLSDFEAAYRANLEIVTTNYSNLFANENALSSDIGSLVFTGTDDDPATLETLSSLGFLDAKKASDIIRSWHFGRYAATRAPVARAHLTELIPMLLKIIARAGNGDIALARFDDFLSRLPTGVQLFAILRTHEDLCRLLIAFMASAPKMAEAVIRRAHVLDGLIDATRTAEIVSSDVLKNKVDSFLQAGEGFEEIIDRARIIGQEEKFLISAGLISGTITGTQAAKQYATLAQTLLEVLFAHVKALFEARHGLVPGARTALLAFGKLGSEQMNVTSDLDVILLFRAPEGSEMSDGDRPLDKSLYFTRLTQRLISAISAQTAEGVLYEVDMRLRPSGNAGPLATSVSAFANYQSEKAWTWEHQALTRARVLCADDEFCTEIDAQLQDILITTNDKDKILLDVAKMRERLLKERPAAHSFDLKLVNGGLMDIEFLTQSAVLIYPKMLMSCRRNTGEILRVLGQEDLLEGAEELAQTYVLMSDILQIANTCLLNTREQDNWNDGFKVLLARLANYPDFGRLEQDIVNMQAKVRTSSTQWFDTKI